MKIRPMIVLMLSLGVLWAAPSCGDDATEGPSTTTAGSGAGGASQGGSGGSGAHAGAGGSGGVGNDACADSLCANVTPVAACMTCVGEHCLAEISACQSDPGSQGAGGSGGQATCEPCAGLIFDPSLPASELCSGSAELFAAFTACVCGDGTSPGHCN